ncbi:MAG: tRNA epoxyqueuosine(34) reductase QueG [Alistipes sp.]|nr:tRNA epoxyqueuosine(34) reductase QueG [Alistipes sp.]
MILHKEVLDLAKEIGFDRCGLTPAQHLAQGERLFRAWLDEGHHSSLDYLTRNIEKRFDPAKLVEGARTVIVCAVSYKSPISEGYPEGAHAKVASYACNRDYHTTLKEMLFELLKALKERYPALEGRAFVDSAPLAEKQFAVAAGLGWIGRNSLLITPDYGSFIHLGELVITEEADHYDAPLQGVGCGACNRCVEACPTGAILAERRMIDTARCIACHTIEREPTNTIDLDGWIFGCDRCQEHCPYNHRAPLHHHPAFDPLFDPRSLTPEEWRTMSEEEFHDRFGTTPMTRSGLHRIQKNL